MVTLIQKFHSTVKWRRVRNGINGLFVDGRWCKDKEVVKDKVKDFFKARSEGAVGPQVRLDNVSFISIFVVDNEMLLSPLSEEEVKGVVWSCDSSKSPGPDGFKFGLIKFYWEFFRDDILLAVNYFASFGKWSKGTNALFVCLVPKLENSQNLCDFRPILLGVCTKSYRSYFLQGLKR